LLRSSTVVSLDDQVAVCVTSRVVLSVSVPVAVNV